MPAMTSQSTSSVRIDAPMNTVWKAVTTPGLIKQWFFGVDTEAEWKVGGKLIHRGEYQGKPYVDRGEILEFTPPRRLVHSHWSDVSGKPDVPENREIVTWDLAEARRRNTVDHHRAEPAFGGGCPNLGSGLEGRPSEPEGPARGLTDDGEPTCPDPTPAPETHVLLDGLGMGESPRWHDGRLWFSSWGTDEIVAVDLDGRTEIMVAAAVAPDGRRDGSPMGACSSPAPSSSASSPTGPVCDTPTCATSRRTAGAR